MNYHPLHDRPDLFLASASAHLAIGRWREANATVRIGIDPYRSIPSADVQALRILQETIRELRGE